MVGATYQTTRQSTPDSRRSHLSAWVTEVGCCTQRSRTLVQELPTWLKWRDVPGHGRGTTSWTGLCYFADGRPTGADRRWPDRRSTVSVELSAFVELQVATEEVTAGSGGLAWPLRSRRGMSSRTTKLHRWSRRRGASTRNSTPIASSHSRELRSTQWHFECKSLASKFVASHLQGRHSTGSIMRRKNRRGIVTRFKS